MKSITFCIFLCSECCCNTMKPDISQVIIQYLLPVKPVKTSSCTSKGSELHRDLIKLHSGESNVPIYSLIDGQVPSSLTEASVIIPVYTQPVRPIMHRVSLASLRVNNAQLWKKHNQWLSVINAAAAAVNAAVTLCYRH